MPRAETLALLPLYAAPVVDAAEIRRRTNLWSMWGAPSCVQRLGRRWAPIWEWPTTYRTKREAMAAVTAYVLAAAQHA